MEKLEWATAEYAMEHTQTDPDIPIIYEDQHILVIDKPHNLLSQKDQTGDPDAHSLCKEYLSDKESGLDSIYLGLIHRLDRPVGGLMMFAKSSRAADKLSRQLRDQTIQKTYWAVSYGDPPENGVLTHNLIKDRDKNIVEVVPESQKEGKTAQLSFARLEKNEPLNLLALHLQTGRPHQIRVQLSSEGYPIWGDYKYDTVNQPDGRTMALRAVKLSFDHPLNEEPIWLELPPPKIEPWSRFDLDKHF